MDFIIKIFLLFTLINDLMGLPRVPYISITILGLGHNLQD